MYVLDSDVFLDLFREYRPSMEAVERLEAEAPIAISSITVHEVARGAYGRKDHARAVGILHRMLSAFDVLDFDGTAGWIAGRLAGDLKGKGRPVGDLDAMIAATAIAHNGILVTRNRRHFERIRGLDVLYL